MPNSMTGFGRADLRLAGDRLICEIRSVNHRFLSPKLRLGSALVAFEPWLLKQLQDSVQRGSIDVFLSLHSSSELAVSRLSTATADHYLQEMRAYLKSRKLPGDLTAEVLFQLPGVLVGPDVADLEKELRPKVEKVVGKALAQFLTMRAREGVRLAKVIRREAQTIATCIRRVSHLGPEIVRSYSRKLSERVNLLLRESGNQLDAGTLAREVAVLADRSDITEEIDRLGSHLRELQSILAKEGSIGRSLEFLVQEIGREIQTVGSKAQDPRITSEVLTAKASVERIREQVQNIE